MGSRLLTGCIFVSGILGFLPSSHAAVTAFTVDGGASRITSTSTTSGTTTTTSYSIFAGYTGAYGGCAGTPATNSTCDSCSAMGTLTSSSNFSCSFNSIHPNLLLSITFQVDTLPATPVVLAKYNNGSTATVLTSMSYSGSVAANSSITVTIPWSDICSAAGNNTTCISGTESDFSGTIEVGLSSDGTSFASGSSKTASIKFHFKDGASGSFSGTSCSGGNTSPFCQFKVLPGDEKVYLTNLSRGGLTPSDASSVKWYALRVYLAQDTGTFAIPLGSGTVQYADFSITDNSKVDSNLSNNKVTGLANEVQYMFTIGSVDETLIVQDIMPASVLNSTDHVARPGKVVGLLDDQKCFIATAAFGSPMEEHVQTLRKFRNQFLLTNAGGKRFVEFYYTYSPPVADFIARHEILRTAVRVALWPLVFMADLAVHLSEEWSQ